MRLNAGERVDPALPEGGDVAFPVLSGAIEIDGAKIVRTAEAVILDRAGVCAV